MQLHVADQFNSLMPCLFFRRGSPQRARKNYLTANICQNYLTLDIILKLYIILKLLPSSFICRIAIQNPSIIQKVLFSPKILFFTLDRELAEPYFPLVEFTTFSQLHPVLINFRISRPSYYIVLVLVVETLCRCQNLFVFNLFAL
jgi:hypothetical protein